jgi:hypothetical protein
MVLESLIECYTHLEEEGEGEERHTPSTKADSPAEKVRAELYEWRRMNGKRIDLMNVIDQEPSKSLHQFLHDLTKFQETTDRVHALMHTQQKAKHRLSTTNTKTYQES